MSKAAFDLKPAINRLQVAIKGATLGKMIGSYRSVFHGHGLEFDGYRSYNPDDDVHMIDWKASARSNDVLVKQFVEERNNNIYLLVDVSESMLYGSAKNMLKIQYAAEVAASIGYAVSRSDDRIGWSIFSDKVKSHRNALPGEAQFYAFARELVNPHYYGGQANIKVVLEEIFPRIPPHSVVILISDFIDLKAGWQKSLKRFCSKLSVISVVVQDLYDRTLPADDVSLVMEHPTTGQQVLVQPALERGAFERAARQYTAMVKSKILEAGSEYLYLPTTESHTKLLLQFFKQREGRRR